LVIAKFGTVWYNIRNHCDGRLKMDGKILYTDGREETLKEGITEIKERAYYKNSNIIKVILPNGVKSIAESAFYGCSSLTSIVIPDSVKEIGRRVFENCFDLKEVRLPDSIKELGGYSFVDCHKLERITLGKNLASIDSSWNNSVKEYLKLYKDLI
jgi:hypothetical protein